jgi:hypothetical protein
MKPEKRKRTELQLQSFRNDLKNIILIRTQMKF